MEPQLRQRPKSLPCNEPSCKECAGRENLLAAATRLFAEKGYHGVSIRAVAEASGTNSAMISYYFGGKENLYATVLKEQFKALEKIDEVGAAGVDPLAKVELYVRHVVERYRKNPHLLRFYTSELTNPTPCFETIVRPALMRVVAVLCGILNEVHHEEHNPMDAVYLLAGMPHFFFLMTSIDPPVLAPTFSSDEDLVERVIYYFKKSFATAGGCLETSSRKSIPREGSTC